MDENLHQVWALPWIHPDFLPNTLSLESGFCLLFSQQHFYSVLTTIVVYYLILATVTVFLKQLLNSSLFQITQIKSKCQHLKQKQLEEINKERKDGGNNMIKEVNIAPKASLIAGMILTTLQ